MLRPRSLTLLLALASAICARGASNATSSRERVLLYAYVGAKGFKHDSIPDAVAAVQQLGKQHDFDTDVNWDQPHAFEDASYLNDYDALGLISVGGTIWTSDKQANNVYRWLIERSGKVFGVHAATTADAPGGWYSTLMGAGFNAHQADQQNAKFVCSDYHVSNAMLPHDYYTGYNEEVYNFDRNPRDTGNIVFMSVDDSSYYGQPANAGQYQGNPHPIAWYRYGTTLPGPGYQGSTWAGGRFWYTSIGHSTEIFEDKLYRQHLLMGVAWTLGRPDDWLAAAEASASASSASSASARASATHARGLLASPPSAISYPFSMRGPLFDDTAILGGFASRPLPSPWTLLALLTLSPATALFASNLL